MPTDRTRIHIKNAFQEDAYRPLQWPFRGGGCLPIGGGSAQKGGVSLAGVCPGDVCPSGSAQEGEGVSAQRGGFCPGGCTPPSVDRMTDACENITFLQLLLRKVIK